MNYNLSVRKKNLVNRNAILLYFIMFISGDTYICGTNSNEIILTVSRSLVIFICILLLFRMHFRLKYSLNKQKIYSYIVIVVFSFVIACLNQETITRTGLKLLWMSVAILLCMLLTFDEYVDCFNKTMYFVSLSSIVFTLVAYVAPDLIRMLPFVVNSVGTRIYTCGFAGLLEGFVGQPLVRTQGIFWEPGAFQLYLNLAIAFEILYKKAANRKSVIVYSLALLLTFSTTGYVVYAWIIIVYLFVKKKTSKQDIIKGFLIAIVLLTIVIMLLHFTEVGNIVFGKIIDKNNANYGSTTTRLAGILVSAKIALSHPLHGIGMINMEEEFFRVSFSLKEILGGWTNDNTNTLFYQFAAHGIPYGILFITGTFKFGNCFAKGRKSMTLAVFITLFLMYVGENIQYSFFPYIIVFYGYGWKESIGITSGQEYQH